MPRLCALRIIAVTLWGDKYMEFKMTVEMDNAAFEGAPATELRRIMAVVSKKVGNGEDGGAVVDINGNKVGSWDMS